MDIFSKTTISPGREEGTYDVRLSLSLTGALAMTVVDFFRPRPAVRFAAGLLGIPLVMGGGWAVLSLEGGFSDWWDIVVYGAILTGTSVFSSSRFNVTMADVDTTQGAEIAETGAPYDAIPAPLRVAQDEALDGLSQSQREARGRFSWGLLCLVVGVAMFGTNVLLLLTEGGAATWHPMLWTSVGTALVLTAGVLLRSWRSAQHRAETIRRELARLREMEAAFVLTELQEDEAMKSAATERIVRILLGPGYDDLDDADSPLLMDPARRVEEG